MHEGELAPFYAMVFEGVCGVYTQDNSPSSAPELRQEAGRGQAFGEVALLQGTPLPASVIAHGECLLLTLGVEDFMTITAGGVSAVLQEKLLFLSSLPQFRELEQEYLRKTLVPAMQARSL